MKINNITQNYNRPVFQAKSFDERLQSRLNNLDWFDRNFCGGTTDSRDAVEREMLREIDSNWDKVHSEKEKLNSCRAYYQQESSRISKLIADIDEEIDEKTALKSFQENEIVDLRNNSSTLKQDAVVSAQKIKSLKIDVKKKKIENNTLNDEIGTIENSIEAIDTSNKIKIATRVEELKENLAVEHNKQIEDLISAPVLYLKQNLIFPLKMLQQGNDLSIPNGVLVNTPFKLFSKIITKWITETSNSDYQKLNAKKYKSEEEFFESLSDISEKSRHNYESTNKHSFTLITNIGKFLKNKNTELLPYLKNFMDTTASDHHNTIILAGSDLSKLDSILTAKHRFPLQINLKRNSVFKKHNISSMFTDLLKIKLKYISNNFTHLV